MFVFLFAVPQSFSASEPSVILTERTSIDASGVQTFSDTIWQDINSGTESGGAIYINNLDTSLLVANCHFLNCSTDGNGGAIYFAGIDATITRFKAVRCSAKHSAFCLLAGMSPATGTLRVTECDVALGASDYNTFYTGFGVDHADPMEEISHFNATNNNAVWWGSGIDIDNHYSVVMSFCTFQSNYPSVTLFLWGGINPADCRCLAFLDNIANNGKEYVGLISANFEIEIRDSIFRNNAYGPLVSDDPDIAPAEPPWIVTLVRCMMDVDGFTAGIGITLQPVDCQVVESGLALDAVRCGPATATETPAQTPDPTVKETLTQTPVQTLAQTPEATVEQTPVQTAEQTGEATPEETKVATATRPFTNWRPAVRTSAIVFACSLFVFFW
jgi:hypothetical protein